MSKFKMSYSITTKLDVNNPTIQKDTHNKLVIVNLQTICDNIKRN